MIDYDKLTEEQKEDLFKFVQDAFNRPGHFASYSHVRVTKVERGHAEGELDIPPEFHNFAGIAHGGCIFTLADTIAGVTAISQGIPCVTLSSSMNFLSARVTGKLRCDARPQRVGRRITVITATVTDEDNVPVAIGTFTFQMCPDMPQTKIEQQWWARQKN